MSKVTLLTAAASLAVKQGFRNIRRQDIAEKCECSTGTVSYHFGSMQVLRDELMAHAVASGNAVIVGQGLAERHPLAMAAPPGLKARALRLLAAA